MSDAAYDTLQEALEDIGRLQVERDQLRKRLDLAEAVAEAAWTRVRNAGWDDERELEQALAAWRAAAESVGKNE